MKRFLVVAALALTACSAGIGGVGNRSLADRQAPGTTQLAVDDPHASMPAPGQCHLGQRDGEPLPDPSCTPGAINPTVTQATISTTICKAGWTATVRPPESVTGPMKRRSAASYGILVTGTEYDHLIPLELGGGPDDPRNLWVEPGKIPNPKDKVENYLNRAVCSGSMPLADAQAGIATNWTRYLAAASAS